LSERSESAAKSRRIITTVPPQGGGVPNALGVVRAQRVGGEEPPH
jgi:hypothetical protein